MLARLWTCDYVRSLVACAVVFEDAFFKEIGVVGRQKAKIFWPRRGGTVTGREIGSVTSLSAPERRNRRIATRGSRSSGIGKKGDLNATRVA